MGVVTELRFPRSAQRNPVETMRSEAEAHEIHSSLTSKASVTKLTVHFSLQNTFLQKRMPFMSILTLSPKCLSPLGKATCLMLLFMANNTHHP